MQYSKKCECCGHKITAYRQKLNKPLVSAFKKMVEKYRETTKPVNLQKHIPTLTHNQSANFQKLQHFGLVYLVKKGWWVPTARGLDFYDGKIMVHDAALSMGNETLDLHHEAWQTKKAPNLVHIEDVSEKRYKQTEEYVLEKTDQTSIFKLLDNLLN